MIEEQMSDDAAAPEVLNVYDVLAIMLEQMASIAWQKMGLQPDPISGKLAPDIAQAKVAVDAVGALSQPLMAALDDEDRRRIQNLVSDLRVNFVQKSQEVGS